MANRTNKASTKRLSFSLDELTHRVLGEMGTIGLYGKNGGEAASYVIRTWLRENRAELQDMGIVLRPRARSKS